MSTVIPRHTRYVPLTQQAYCCVPTSLQMVMLRQRIPLVSAELIGHYLNLTVPESDQHLFYQVKTGPKPGAGYGTSVNPANLQQLFTEFNIPLRTSFRLIDSLTNSQELLDLIDQQIRLDRDLLACFDYPTLNQLDEEKSGHIVIIDYVDIKNRTVSIVDPSRHAPKWRTYSIEDLYRAMQVHTSQHQAGVWLFEKTEPEIICVSGSLRFQEKIMAVTEDLELKGNCVLSVIYPAKYQKDEYSPTQCEQFDRMHRRRIELADSLFVVNVGGYIGTSTRNEIAYAVQLGKKIAYLEEVLQ